MPLGNKDSWAEGIGIDPVNIQKDVENHGKSTFCRAFSWGNHGFSTSMLVYSSLSPKVVLIWVSREDDATEYCLLVHHTSSQTCACGGRYEGIHIHLIVHVLK